MARVDRRCDACGGLRDGGAECLTCEALRKVSIPIAPPTDPINPSHYRSHPSGVECITIAEPFGFNLGNAIKYIWRAGLKSKDPIEDLKKARWYLDREIARLEGAST